MSNRRMMPFNPSLGLSTGGKAPSGPTTPPAHTPPPMIGSVPGNAGAQNGGTKSRPPSGRGNMIPHQSPPVVGAVPGQSGLDKALSDHADKMHPVKRR